MLTRRIGKESRRLLHRIGDLTAKGRGGRMVEVDSLMRQRQRHTRHLWLRSRLVPHGRGVGQEGRDPVEATLERVGAGGKGHPHMPISAKGTPRDEGHLLPLEKRLTPLNASRDAS